MLDGTSQSLIVGNNDALWSPWIQHGMEDHFFSRLLSAFGAPGNYNWDVMYWTTMWGKRGYLPATLCDVHWRSWGSEINIQRHAPATVTTLSMLSHTFQGTIYKEQQMCRSSPPTRHGSLTGEQQTKQTILSRSMDLWRSSAQRRAPDWTMCRGGHSLDVDGHWDALLRYGCWEGETKPKKCKDTQYLACNLEALWASRKHF
jgi:hypothetical protein